MWKCLGGVNTCVYKNKSKHSVCWSCFGNQSRCSLACEYCLRALETAEENARRLSALPSLSLPHPELCKVRPELHQACPHCQVPQFHTLVHPNAILNQSSLCFMISFILSVRVFSCPGYLACLDLSSDL